MTDERVIYREIKDLPEPDLRRLYRENGWFDLASDLPRLRQSLRESHRVVSAWDHKTLLGLGNALSDGYSVAFYSHLLVLPSHQRQGIGSAVLERLREPYRQFNQQVLITDDQTTGFYRRHGFAPVHEDKATGTSAMWIYRR